MKKSWAEWSMLLVKRTGKCPGPLPGFGLPSDLLNESEFKQSVSGMTFHKSQSCNCFPEPEKEANLDEILKDLKEVAGNQFKERLSTSDSAEAILGVTERNVRERTVVLKNKLMALVGMISVDNFHINKERRVDWRVNIPRSLLLVLDSLRSLSPPDHESKPEKPILPPGVLPYEPPPVE